MTKQYCGLFYLCRVSSRYALLRAAYILHPPLHRHVSVCVRTLLIPRTHSTQAPMCAPHEACGYG